MNTSGRRLKKKFAGNGTVNFARRVEYEPYKSGAEINTNTMNRHVSLKRYMVECNQVAERR